MSSSRLLLAEDNPAFAKMIAELLRDRFNVVGISQSGADALRQVPSLCPDILILDISLGDMSGLEVARKIKKTQCNCKIVFLSMHESPEFVRAAFELGASAYVFKSRMDPDLIQAIRLVSTGGTFIPY